MKRFTWKTKQGKTVTAYVVNGVIFYGRGSPCPFGAILIPNGTAPSPCENNA